MVNKKLYIPEYYLRVKPAELNSRGFVYIELGLWYISKGCRILFLSKQEEASCLSKKTF